MIRSLVLNRLPLIAKKNLLLQNKGNFLRQTIARNGHDEVYYRTTLPPDPPKNKILITVGTIMWWYFFWTLFTSPHLLTGHKYPDPSKWTDEELGIPED